MSPTNVARAGKRGNISVGNNVSSFARALRLSLFRFFSAVQSTSLLVIRGCVSFQCPIDSGQRVVDRSTCDGEVGVVKVTRQQR